MQLDGLLFTEDGDGIVVDRRDLFLGTFSRKSLTTGRGTLCAAANQRQL